MRNNEDWPLVSLGDVAEEITVGHVGPMASEYLPSGIPFLRSQNVEPFAVKTEGMRYISPAFHETLRKSALSPGDVVIVRTGKPGAAAVIPDWLPVSNCSDLVIIHTGTNLDSSFLAYYLNSAARLHVSAHLVGAVQQHFNVASARSIKLCLPPLAEQKAIAEILGMFDDKIELNRRMNETLEAIARATFKSWFVDFDPVRAKAEGRQPFGMDAGTAVLFPRSFEDSPVGKIPRGWKVAPLPDAFQINPPHPLIKGRPTTYLDMQNMPTQGHWPIGWISRPFVSGSRFANGDTLIARITPCLENGKTAYVDFLKEGEIGWGSTEFIVLRPRDPLPPEYGYCLARDKEFRDFAIQNMTGSSGRQRVPTDCFARYFVTIPPELVARRFGQVVRLLFEKVKANSEESATLAVIRDALLPKLISGGIRIPTFRKAVEQNV